ncbi:MAG: PfkB family carbohydrate kinase [Pseudomonadota bacterium]
MSRGISQAISDSAAAAVHEAMTIARMAGGAVSYDTNLRLKLWPLEKAREVIHGAMTRADIALPGLEDARHLTGLEAPEDIARFYMDLGPHTVALTLGPQGALVATKAAMTHIPPRPADAVDASGAGDCFDGAFLAEWLRRGDPVSAGHYAVTAASLSVEGIGAVAPIPNAQEVRAAMNAG